MQQYEFHPLANAYPMMTGWEYEQLKRDLCENGQRNRIALYQGMILDGRNRYMALTALGIEPEFKEVFFEAEDAARAFVASMNDRRRHESNDVVRARTEQRRETVAKLRADGMSTRAIAEQVGVSKSQVDRDLSTVPPGTVQPETITGKDGKGRPAVRKTKFTKTVEEPVNVPASDSEILNGSDGDADEVVDEATGELTAEETTEAILDTLRDDIGQWSERLIELDLTNEQVEQIRNWLKAFLEKIK
jgi:hypothetical protein